jgi:hypothetical protein
MKGARSFLGAWAVALACLVMTWAAPSAARASEFVTSQPVGSNLAIGSQINTGRTRVFFRSGNYALYASDKQANGTWATAPLPTYNATTWAPLANVLGNIAVDPFTDFSGGSTSLYYKGTDTCVWWAYLTIHQGNWAWFCRKVGTAGVASDLIVNNDYSVVYRAIDNRVWSNWRDSTGQWQQATQGPLANVTGNLAKNPIWDGIVYYRGTDGCLWTCNWTPTGFVNRRLSTLANMASAPAIMGDGVVYRNTTGGVSRAWQNGVGTWEHRVLYTPSTAYPWTYPVLTGEPAVAALDPSNVYFRAANYVMIRVNEGGGHQWGANDAWGSPYAHPSRGVFYPSTGIRRF